MTTATETFQLPPVVFILLVAAALLARTYLRTSQADPLSPDFPLAHPSVALTGTNSAQDGQSRAAPAGSGEGGGGGGGAAAAADTSRGAVETSEEIGFLVSVHSRRWQDRHDADDEEDDGYDELQLRQQPQQRQQQPPRYYDSSEGDGGDDIAGSRLDSGSRRWEPTSVSAHSTPSSLSLQWAPAWYHSSRPKGDRCGS